MWRYFIYGFANSVVIYVIIRLTGLSEAGWGTSVIACAVIGAALGLVWFLILRQKKSPQES